MSNPDNEDRREYDKDEEEKEVGEGRYGEKTDAADNAEIAQDEEGGSGGKRPGDDLQPAYLIRAVEEDMDDEVRLGCGCGGEFRDIEMRSEGQSGGGGENDRDGGEGEVNSGEEGEDGGGDFDSDESILLSLSSVGVHGGGGMMRFGGQPTSYLAPVVLAGMLTRGGGVRRSRVRLPAHHFGGGRETLAEAASEWAGRIARGLDLVRPERCRGQGGGGGGMPTAGGGGADGTEPEAWGGGEKIATTSPERDLPPVSGARRQSQRTSARCAPIRRTASDFARLDLSLRRELDLPSPPPSSSSLSETTQVSSSSLGFPEAKVYTSRMRRGKRRFPDLPPEPPRASYVSLAERALHASRLTGYLSEALRVPGTIRSNALAEFLSSSSRDGISAAVQRQYCRLSSSLTPRGKEENEENDGGGGNGNGNTRGENTYLDYLLPPSPDSEGGLEEDECGIFPRRGAYTRFIPSVPPGWWIVWRLRVEELPPSCPAATRRPRVFPFPSLVLPGVFPSPLGGE